MCVCADGYVGSRCEVDIARADCMQQPCLNGGTCVTAIGSYSCLCQEYYEVLSTCYTIADDDELFIVYRAPTASISSTHVHLVLV